MRTKEKRERSTILVEGNEVSVQPRQTHADMTEREIEEFIRSHSWTFAKTMPQSPHWYVVKKKCRNAHEFERFVVHIRKHGYRRKHKKSYYKSLDVEIDGSTHYYWTMGFPLFRPLGGQREEDLTIIINRAVKEVSVRSETLAGERL